MITPVVVSVEISCRRVEGALNFVKFIEDSNSNLDLKSENHAVLGMLAKLKVK